jgi:RND family efflux transporter MFP subunit
VSCARGAITKSNLEMSESMTFTQLSLSSKFKKAGTPSATILICAAFLAGCGSSTKVNANDTANAPRVAVVKVTRHDLSSTLEIASEFQPYQEVSVYAKVSGYIKSLDVNWGTHVRQGQLLAVLEVPELQQQLEVDQAEARRGEQNVGRAKEELNGAESAHKVANLTFTRLANVQKARPELVAQEEVDAAEGKDTETSAAVSAAKDALAASEQALVAAQASLEKDRAMYAYARITAPFDGVVTEIGAYTGALLPAGTSSNKGDQSLCHLSQNDLLRLVIPVPERAVADVPVGQTVAVSVSTLNKTFDGKVARISDQIDTSTRTMYTEVDVPNPSYQLVPGMYASVRIPLKTAHNVLTLPLQSVQSSAAGQGAVLVVNSDNKIEKRDVTLGLESDTTAEILSGVKENEQVVVGEQSQYKTGELVAPQTAASLESE